MSERHARCTIPGCTWIGWPERLDEHRQATHVECRCGWVGLVHARHVRHALRRGEAASLHQLVVEHVTPDVEDVIAALTAALELAEVWLVDGAPGSIPDRVRAYELVRDWRRQGGRLSEVQATLGDVLAAELTVPVRVDGTLYRSSRRAKRSGFDRPALRSAVSTVALAPVPLVDPETAEVTGHRDPTAQEAVEVVWAAADVQTGRTAVLRDRFGLDLDEYASTTWAQEFAQVVDADLPPDQLDTIKEYP